VGLSLICGYLNLYASFHNKIDISGTIAQKSVGQKTHDLKPNEEKHRMGHVIWS
jgi:hypothetical protein